MSETLHRVRDRRKEPDTASAMTAGVHESTTTWSIGLSALMIVAGLLAIGLPVVAGVTVTAIIGRLLLLSGALHLAFAVAIYPFVEGVLELTLSFRLRPSA